MAAQLIWIIVVYASAVVFVNLLHIREKMRQSPRSGEWIHYILITRNHETVIEWYVRALTLHSFLTGKRLRVTCMDDNSDDDTLLLVMKMKQSGCSLEVEALEHLEERSTAQRDGNLGLEQEIIIDLRLFEGLFPLPFIQDLGSRGYGSKPGGM
ncbi:hypothetical protein [Paenibacillus wynnii]|uniref:hypothetical protein n=1 Tax=Paenibacillus wynnii TaxID=268407 RepID=UPI000689FB0F|nr:hypothetical protein [Paenibacillus wynnii]